MKEVLAMSAAQTYNTVMLNGIHAYPNMPPYPDGEATFFIPVGPNGIMENLFFIAYKAICNPANIESLKEELDSVDPYFYGRLMDYHKERESFYGYRENCEFVFLFLFPVCAIRQPFKYQIRNAKYYSTEEIPCIGQETVLEPIKADHAWIFSYDAGKFSIHAAMRFLPSIDWDVSNSITRGKVKNNDIVYLYGASPEQKIYYRCRVIKDGKTRTTVDDSPYGGNPADTPCDCVELELECKYADGIPYKVLREHGLKGGTLSKRRIDNAELVSFLNDFDADVDNLDNWFRDSDTEEDEELEISAEDVKKAIHEIEEGTENLLGREREVVIKGRVNQGIFRDRLLARYNKCCLCQVNDKRFLIASHIKPWSDSEDDEKLDPDNGLLLCPNHDKAFDGAYITFDDDGKIIISDELSEENRVFLNIREGMHIDMNEGRRKYIKYHREELFNK